MPSRRAPKPQMPLFGDGAAPAAGPNDRAELASLAAKLPPRLRLGTSSWTFEGWQGLVYRRAYTKASFQRDSLAEYVEHPLFRTVGIDSTYYTPPRPDLLAR